MDKIINKLYDTLQLGRTLLFDQAVFNLTALSEFFGLSSDGAHRAEKDTENCGVIFLHLLNELAAYPLTFFTKVFHTILKDRIEISHYY